jgi:signal transduction histidine kinase
VSEQAADLTAFDTVATASEQSYFHAIDAGPLVNRAELIEEYVLSVGSLDTSNALNISKAAAPGQWYSAMSDTVGKMQQAELNVARNIVSRSQVLQHGAEQSALFTAVVTALILLLVLIGALAVARSLVRPLRRLRAGALDIATVQLPERVRQLSDAQDPTTSLEVSPIDVLSADEIGQVARAFDQVHSEAVRLAGNEAVLRRSFNAMFVNLSRRSQSLIERLARLIDSLEQNEQDPGRLSSLFAMDHLVTRMRRNSENLLLLAGHESARKWSEPVSIADVTRAATSEIEQYNRVTLNVQPGVAVTGQAVTDVVHLLAEIVENATTFSPKDTQVHLTAQELSSGGVLIEVSDNGVGIPEARLADLNWRLDNPPVIDVSVSRHMGLFAVAHLAGRHGVRVRLRARSPRGLTALIWLPDSVTERGPQPYGRRSRPLAEASFQIRGTSGAHGTTARSASEAQVANDRLDAASAASPWEPAPSPRETAPSSREIAPPAATREAAPSPWEPAPSPWETAPAAPAATREAAQAAAPATSSWFSLTEPFATGPASDVTSGTDPGGGTSHGTEGWSDDQRAADVVANPVRGDQTAAGLPVRIPRANLLPGSAGVAQRPGGGVSSRPAEGRDTRTHAAALPQRSPDTARSRLSGFQHGRRRATGHAPRAGEGADR